MRNAPAQGARGGTRTRCRVDMITNRSPLRGPPACCGTFDRDLRLTTAITTTSGLWVELLVRLYASGQVAAKSPS